MSRNFSRRWVRNPERSPSRDENLTEATAEVAPLKWSKTAGKARQPELRCDEAELAGGDFIAGPLSTGSATPLDGSVSEAARGGAPPGSRLTETSSPADRPALVYQIPSGEVRLSLVPDTRILETTAASAVTITTEVQYLPPKGAAQSASETALEAIILIDSSPCIDQEGMERCCDLAYEMVSRMKHAGDRVAVVAFGCHKTEEDEMELPLLSWGVPNTFLMKEKLRALVAAPRSMEAPCQTGSEDLDLPTHGSKIFGASKAAFDAAIRHCAFGDTPPKHIFILSTDRIETVPEARVGDVVSLTNPDPGVTAAEQAESLLADARATRLGLPLTNLNIMVWGQPYHSLIRSAGQQNVPRLHLGETAQVVSEVWVSSMTPLRQPLAASRRSEGRQYAAMMKAFDEVEDLIGLTEQEVLGALVTFNEPLGGEWQSLRAGCRIGRPSHGSPWGGN